MVGGSVAEALWCRSVLSPDPGPLSMEPGVPGGPLVPPPGHPHHDRRLPWLPEEGSKARPWVADPSSRGTNSAPKIWGLRERERASRESRGKKS